MDYKCLLDFALELGYQLSINGAETYRVEETLNKVLTAYGLTPEVFVIPNSLYACIETPSGEILSRMRRVGAQGNDLDFVERYNSLSRRVCAEKPELSVAMQWLVEAKQTHKSYPFYIILIGSILVSIGYACLFGGRVSDCIGALFCGIIVAVCKYKADQWKVNAFFSTIMATFFMSLFSYIMAILGFVSNPDMMIIGAMMLLVPGLLFTNALRDIIHGDTNSGMNRVVHVLLIAAGLAIGSAIALNLTDNLFDSFVAGEPQSHALWLELIACFAAGVGFMTVFNIHGSGGLLCPLGGCVAWAIYRGMELWTGDAALSTFVAAASTSLYSELVARMRKCPTISYQVISILPLLPGAGIYYASNHFARGNGTAFAQMASQTAILSGCIAIGILAVSSVFRLYSDNKRRHTEHKAADASTKN